MIAAAFIQQAQALDAKAFQARCADLSKAKDWPGLEALARAQASADPKDAAAQAALGFALLAQGKGDEGRKACEQSIALDPKNEKPYIYLGLSYAQAKDRDGIIRTGQRLSGALPFAVKDYYLVAAIAEASGSDPNEPFDSRSPLAHGQAWPQYPPEARFTHVEGAIAIELHVGADGIPLSTAVLAGPPLLATRPILEFAKSSRFNVLIKNGVAVPFRTIQTYIFKIAP